MNKILSIQETKERIIDFDVYNLQKKIVDSDYKKCPVCFSNIDDKKLEKIKDST